MDAVELFHSAWRDANIKERGGEFFSSLLEDRGDALFPVRVAISFRNARRFAVADLILLYVLNIDVNNEYALYEAGLSRSLQGDAHGSISFLERLIILRPTLWKAVKLFASQYARIGNSERARSIISSYKAVSRCEQRDLLATLGFINYLEVYTRERAEQEVKALHDVTPMMSAEAVFNKITAAVEERRPFSLVRLGDGEGAWLSISNSDELKYQCLYRENREDFFKSWFGSVEQQEGEAWHAAIAAFHRSVRNADILGIPTANWIGHEYEIGSRRGISTTLNVIRFVKGVSKELTLLGAVPCTCAQTIHVDLGRSGYLERMLSSQQAVGIVSCHQELQQIVAHRFGVPDVDFYFTPGEQMSKRLIGDQAASGVHFPDKYEQIRADINVRSAGQVFLVASGILGKVYCDEIKRRGGIALDIGSVADAWMGMNTRPLFNNTELSLKRQ